MGRPLLRVITAAYPSSHEPRRAHFIEELHRLLEVSFCSEVLAPRVFQQDSLQESRQGIAVTRFAYRSHNRLPKSGGMSPAAIASYLWRADRAAARLWRRGADRSGLVLGHWVLPTGWIAARVARRLGLPLVLYGHGTDIHSLAQRWPGSWVAPSVIRQARRVLLASAELAAQAQELSGCASSKFLVRPIGIGEAFRTKKKRCHNKELGPRSQLLFVGDLIVSKGCAALVEALRRWQVQGPSVQLTVIGEGPFAAALKAQGAILLGQQSAAEVAAAMRSHHLLLHPSWAEGSPLVIQEAIASALPVAATAVGGIPDLFVNRGGWLPLPEKVDGKTLSHKIGRLLEDRSSYTKLASSMNVNETQSLFAKARASQVAEDLEELLRDV